MGFQFFLVWIALAPGPAPTGPTSSANALSMAGASREAASGRRLLQDVGVAAAGTLAVAALKPDIRRALRHDARFSNVVRNFTHPIEQIRVGTRRDSDPFWVNGVAHPGLFALEALYFKRRGYSDGGAFAITQVHSVLWEFAVEGSAFEPSGRDLLADAAGAGAALWLLRPVAERSARKLAQGRARWWDRALRWLDPVSALAGHQEPSSVALRPSWGRGSVGLEVSATF